MIRRIQRNGREGTLAHPIQSLSVLADACVEAPMMTMTRSPMRRYAKENENALRFDLFCRTGRRKGARPRRGEWIYRARLRGNVIKIDKFSFIPNWCWCTCVKNKNKADAKSLQLSALANGASASANHSIRASSLNQKESELQPLMLLPPLPSIAPESVFKKLNGRKRLHSDASMALATLQEEAVRALVELSSKDKEDDLRRMGEGYQRPRRNKRNRSIETNTSITNGVFPGEKIKRLEYYK